VFEIKLVENIKTHFMLDKRFFSSENRAVYEIRWKMWYSRTDHRRQYGTGPLHAR